MIFIEKPTGFSFISIEINIPFVGLKEPAFRYSCKQNLTRGTKVRHGAVNSELYHVLSTELASSTNGEIGKAQKSKNLNVLPDCGCQILLVSPYKQSCTMCALIHGSQRAT